MKIYQNYQQVGRQIFIEAGEISGDLIRQLSAAEGELDKAARVDERTEAVLEELAGLIKKALDEAKNPHPDAGFIAGKVKKARDLTGDFKSLAGVADALSKTIDVIARVLI